MNDANLIIEDAVPSPDMHSAAPLQTSSPHPSTSPPTHPSSLGTPIASTPEPEPDSQSLQSAFDSLSLAGPGEGGMFRSLAVIFRSAQEQEGSVNLTSGGADFVWAALQRADTSRQRLQDTSALRAAKDVLEQMLWNQSHLLVEAAKILADSSRDAAWRDPLGDAGIVNFFLSVIASGTASDQLMIHALRLVGNTCGDNGELSHFKAAEVDKCSQMCMTDANRQRVISDNNLRFIVKQLENPRLLSIVIPVLYNVCSDFEPAQRLALSDGVYLRLIEILENGLLASTPTLSYLCRLLDFFEDSLNADDSSENAVEVLFRAASSPDLDVDDRVSLVDAAIAHLKLEDYQRHMVAFDLVDLPLSLLVQWYLPPRASSSRQISSAEVLTPSIRDAGEEEQLSLMRSNIIQILSDVSAMPEFAARYASMELPLVETLLGWLAGPHTQLQLCSCIMLGNLARSDSTCRVMISKFSVQESLLDILKISSDTQVLHSVLGFLRNLGLLPVNKRILGKAGTIEIVSRFINIEAIPQLAHAAVSLVRQVINGSMNNISDLLSSLSLDEESPAHSKTYLSLMLSLFDKSDDVAVKVEVSRVIAAVLRCLHSSQALANPRLRDQLLHRLFSLHLNLCQPLSMMVTQPRWPIIRSEGWFAMALASRTAEGSISIDTALQQVEVFGALDATIHGDSTLIAAPSSDPVAITSNAAESPESIESKPSVEDEAEMRAKDRENAMVLVNELLKNREHDQLAHATAIVHRPRTTKYLAHPVHAGSVRRMPVLARKPPMEDFSPPRPTSPPRNDRVVHGLPDTRITYDEMAGMDRNG
ncbi:hypothetical protein MMC26_000554 [Xylographa opegraphella]|nr:hypothetical protein [Xylographa opegraphella]